MMVFHVPSLWLFLLVNVPLLQSYNSLTPSRLAVWKLYDYSLYSSNEIAQEGKNSFLKKIEMELFTDSIDYNLIQSEYNAIPAGQTSHRTESINIISANMLDSKKFQNMLRKERENAVRSVSFLGGLLSVIITRDIWYAASSFLIVNIFAAQPNNLGTATRILGATLDMLVKEFIKALRFLGLCKAQSTDRNNIGDLLKSRIASVTKSLRLDPSTTKRSSSNDFVVPADERERVYMAEIVMEVEKEDKVGNDRLNSKDFELSYDDTDFFDNIDIRGTSVKKANDVSVEKKDGFASEIKLEGGDNSKEGNEKLSRTDAEYSRLEREASYLNMDSIADKNKIITTESNTKSSANTSDSLPFYKIPVGSLNPTGTVTPVTPIGTITPITNSSGKIPLGTLISSASRNTYEIPMPAKKTTLVLEKEVKIMGGVSQSVNVYIHTC